MKKNKDSLNFVKTGLFECLEDYHKIKVDISRFRLVTQGEYIDIIRDSNVSGQQEEVQYENQSDVDQYKYNKY